jgi:hypothetical protein
LLVAVPVEESVVAVPVAIVARLLEKIPVAAQVQNQN